jgi:hypothetical protein
MKLNLVILSLFIGFIAQAQDPSPIESVQEEAFAYETEKPSLENVQKAQQEIDELFPERFVESFVIDRERVLQNYHHIDPQGIVPDDLLEDALVYFDSNSGFKNRRYITIVDYSKPSWEKRLFIINMADGSVYARHASHGRNSDPNHDGYLDSYSNTPNSWQSSKGFYRAAEIYWSSNQNIGRAMRLDGLQSSNSNARARGIVFHGASYTQDRNVKQGRSLGCVTISWKDKDDILDILKGGSLLYVNNSRL